MRQAWLRTNRRAVAAGLLLPAILLVAALVGLLGPFGPAVRWISAGVVLVSLAMAACLIWMMRLPRLAYQDGWLLVYMSSTVPERVPIDAVECFFLGQAPSLMPEREGEKAARTRAIVVRLAESAEQYRERQVRPALGQWCAAVNCSFSRRISCGSIGSHQVPRIVM
jgi:hypothetical protein